MRARGRDGLVADRVAVEAGAHVEDALDHSLTAALCNCSVERCEHVVEPSSGRIDRGLHLGELVGVFHEAQLRGRAGELFVLERHVCIARLELVEIRGAQAEVCCDLLE